jgi:hypothetical protein
MKWLMNRNILVSGVAILVALGLAFIPTKSALAGDPPGGVIGPRNPTMYKCIEGDNIEYYQPDPFIKRTATRFFEGGKEIEFAVLDDKGKPIFKNGPALLDSAFREANMPDARNQTCNNPMDIYYGFDPTDSVQFESYLHELKRSCDKAGGKLIPMLETRVEGYVYEFHQNSDGSWFSVPSRDVPVILNGIGTDLTWGTNDDGYYIFKGLGAGPLVVNLRLPPDAHPINPNVAIFSNGQRETWTVFMGFYRGDTPPKDAAFVTTPEGNYLPFTNPTDIDMLRQCGYLGSPTGKNIPLEIWDMSFGMPSVGGEARPNDPTSTISSALAVLSLLFVAGGITAYSRRWR